MLFGINKQRALTTLVCVLILLLKLKEKALLDAVALINTGLCDLQLLLLLLLLVRVPLVQRPNRNNTIAFVCLIQLLCSWLIETWIALNTQDFKTLSLQ